MADASTIQNTAWLRAQLSLTVLSVDPLGLGGLCVRARASPVRDTFLAGLKRLALPLRKIHPNITDSQLFGGIDLSQVLSTGRVTETRGVLGEPNAIVLTMAERCPKRLAAHLGHALDNATHPVIALDEGADGTEIAPPVLTDRLGLFVSLDGMRGVVGRGAYPDRMMLDGARHLVERVTIGDKRSRDLVTLALHLGIDSLRAPLQAIAAARCLAALDDRDAVSDEDVSTASQLVYAHRAHPPADGSDEEDAPPPPETPDTQGPDRGDVSANEEDAPPPELLLDAVRAALPPEVLASLAEGRATRAAAGASGSGAARRGNRRGRPVPSRPGRPNGQNRLDIVATLRAAAPWQRLRAPGGDPGQLIRIRPSDLRVRRFEDRSDRLLIFCVDASGSLALARLAEAKGAVELLLAEAYSRRDHVALIAFRGDRAELLLPPTRSLVQTRRRLAALPGGGGTPLASGLSLALDTACQARARGMTPTVVLLTDGRANIALDGSPGRQQAAADAERIARLLRADGVPALVIDTSPRPQAAVAGLSSLLDATHIALPRADAERLSAAISATLRDA